MHRAGAGLLLLLFLTAGCESRRQAKVEGIWVPQADGLSKALEGPTLTVERGHDPELPDDPAVRLAVARDVEWKQVRTIRERLLQAGQSPQLMVASNRKVGAIELYDDLEGETISVHVTVEGKLCVSPPGTPEAKCVQSKSQQHVDRAFTRELVREAVEGYGLEDVEITVPPDISWADVVRAVDGARTCCYEREVRVRLK